MNKERDSYFDVVKAIAIFMVLLSHVIFYRADFDLNVMPSYILNFVMSINMPLFFIISGYFSQKLHTSSDYGSLKRRLLSYFYPFAVLSIAIAVFEGVVLGKYSLSAIPLWAIKKFLFSGWFFYALAGCDIITYCACRFGKTVMLKFGIALCCFIACMMLDGKVWYVGSIVSMIPFYWFGFGLLPKILNNKLVFAAMGLFGGVVLIFVTYFYGSIATNGLAFYWDRFDIYNPQKIKLFNMLARYVVGIVGSLFVCIIVRWTLDVIPIISKSSMLGLETLGIYLVQDAVIHYGANRFTTLESSSFELVLVALGTLLVCFFIVRILKINQCMRRIIWRLC